MNYMKAPPILQPVKSSVYDQKLRANSRSERPQSKKEKDEFEKQMEKLVVNDKEEDDTMVKDIEEREKNIINGRERDEKEAPADKIKLSSLSSDLTSCRGIGERLPSLS